MRFSVLVPVYNAENYIERCLSAILSQDCRDFEIIAVDDGSTDQSGKILDRFAETDKRVRVYHTENRGVFLARAYLESHAKGDYILHVDADDIVHPHILSVLSQEIDRNNPDLCFYDFEVRMGDTVRRESYFDTPMIFEGEDLQTIYALQFSTRFNSLCHKCFRRSLISAAPQYNHYHALRHGEDLLRTSHLTFAAKKISYIPKALYTYIFGIGHSARFDPNSLQNYNIIYGVLQKLLYEKVDKSPEWDRITHDLCRKQLDNALSLMAGSKMPIKKCVALLKANENTDFLRSALDTDSEKFKYRLLRKKRYRLLLCLLRIRRWMRA